MTSVKLGDDFLRIPKLDASGKNWVSFRDRFRIAADARGHLGHIDGSETEPRDPIDRTGTSPLTAAQAAQEAEWKRELKTWKQGEAIMKQQIVGSIPDSEFIKIRGQPTALGMWTALSNQFQNKSRMVSVDLRRRLQEERCDEKGDVRAHLNKLRGMREDLASMGQPPTEEDFYAIILGSLPSSLDAYISAINATSSVTGQTISADDLMMTVTDEAERRSLKAKGARKGDDAAFYFGDSSKGKGAGSGKSSSAKRNAECYNCKKKGHFKSDCWAPGGGKEGLGPRNKGKGKENAATAKATSDEDAAWMSRAETNVMGFVEDGQPQFWNDQVRIGERLDDEDYPGGGDQSDAEDMDAPGAGTVSPTESGFQCYESDDEDAMDVPDTGAGGPMSHAFDDLFEDFSSIDMVTDDDQGMPPLASVSDSEYSDEEDSDAGMPGSDISDCEASGTEDSDAGMPGLETPSDSESEDEDGVGEDTDREFTSFDAAMLTAVGLGSDVVDVDLYDSGATKHMTGNRGRLFNFVEIPAKPIMAADNLTFNAIGKGDMYVVIPNCDNAPSRVLLKDVLYAPTMGVTLVSISRIDAAGWGVWFGDGACRIYNKMRKLMGRIDVKGGLYRVFHPRKSAAKETAASTKEKMSVDELHRRMGHMAHEAAIKLVKDGLVTGIDLDMSSKPSTCETCEHAKMRRKAIRKTREDLPEDEIGGRIHADLWGPAPVQTKKHKRYYASFTDDKSRFTQIYFLREKSEAFDSYRKYEAWLETQRKVKIKCLQCDRGGEFTSDEFKDHLERHGTVRRLTTHDTPEYNGIAERLNLTLLTKVRAMIHESGLPPSLWAEAVHHANWLKNRSSTKVLIKMTPLEVFEGKKPDLSDIHPWGCKVLVHDDGNSKLGDRGKLGHWVGFDEESNAHRIYWPDKGTIGIERSVNFRLEDEEMVKVPLEGEWDFDDRPTSPTHGKPESEQSAEDPTPAVPVARKVTVEEVRDADAPPIAGPDHLGENFEVPDDDGGRGKRVRKESSYIRRLREGEGVQSHFPRDAVIPRGVQKAPGIPEAGVLPDEGHATSDDWQVVAVEDYAMASVIADAEGLEPTFEEAKKRPDWPQWQKAIRAELDALEANGTWSVVKRPTGVNVVGAKWVLKIKKNSAGEIEKYKARLVAKGFTQIYGVDFYETFAPVAKLASFRLLLAIAARNGWPIDTFDFHSAFLNATLSEDEEIYLEQPPDYTTKDRKDYVLRLHKSIYGLRQGARNWYDLLCKALADLGFRRTESDHGVFFKEVGNHLIVLAVHVDDCMVTGSSVELIGKFKAEMKDKYPLTDLGPIHWLLGIKVTRDLAERTITLSQHTYIESIITRFNFNDLKPCSTPLDPNLPLTKAQSPTTSTEIARMKNVQYREAIGSLMYAAMGTRPDIAFAVSTLSQFSENPGWVHWEAVKHVFRYLLGTKKLELVYGGEKRGLVGYVDADGASQDHRRAITGYAFLIDGAAVSWSSKKQELVTLSTTEAEYVAATHAAKEALWMRRLIGEVFRPLSEPTPLFSDSKSAIALAQDGHYHARTKHIDIRYHFIRYIIEAGSLKLIYCPTDEMTADTLTKALPSAKAKHFAAALGLVSAV